MTSIRHHTVVLAGDVRPGSSAKDVAFCVLSFRGDLSDRSVLSPASGSRGVDEAAEGALERINLSLANYTIDCGFGRARPGHLKTGCANPGSGG